MRILHIAFHFFILDKKNLANIMGKLLNRALMNLALNFTLIIKEYINLFKRTL